MPEEEGGTLLGRTVRLTYGKGSAAEVKEVIDHYRVVLREAGWEITFEEELDPEEQPSVDYPGKRLGYDVDGHRGTVTASQHEDHVRIILSVYESQPDRAPYSTYPPLIDLPGWYDVLPEPPEQIRRARVEVWYREAPTTFYWIEYLEYSLTGQQGDVDSVADHYRGLLGQSGWQIFEEKRHSEEDELPHTIHRHEEVVFDIAGHGVTGKISVSQSSWQEGQWTPASVTVTIDELTSYRLPLPRKVREWPGGQDSPLGFRARSPQDTTGRLDGSAAPTSVDVTAQQHLKRYRLASVVLCGSPCRLIACDLAYEVRLPHRCR